VLGIATICLGRADLMRDAWGQWRFSPSRAPSSKEHAGANSAVQIARSAEEL
jgi:hypothetical protein